MEGSRFTIAQLAKSAGVGVETVRYYERRGLIRQPTREHGSIRRYDSDHVRRIQFVRRAQELGFTLDEVASLLALEDGTNRANIRRIATARLAQIHSRIEDLRRIEAALSRLLKECEDGKNHVCPIIDALNGADSAAVPPTARELRRRA